MTTLSNELGPSFFVTSPDVKMRVLAPGGHIEVGVSSTPVVKLQVPRAARTPTVRNAVSLTLMAIPANDVPIGDWRLLSALLVRVERDRRRSIATTWLESVAEYGVGRNEDEAILDLVGSLGDYRVSLERREARLGESARRELTLLRKLIAHADE